MTHHKSSKADKWPKVHTLLRSEDLLERSLHGYECTLRDSFDWIKVLVQTNFWLPPEKQFNSNIIPLLYRTKFCVANQEICLSVFEQGSCLMQLDGSLNVACVSVLRWFVQSEKCTSRYLSKYYMRRVLYCFLILSSWFYHVARGDDTGMNCQ